MMAWYGHVINVYSDINDESCDHNNEDGFEEKQENKLINTMVQYIIF